MADNFETEEELPEQAPNRGFMIAVWTIGGLLVVGLICLTLYLTVISPRQKAEQDRQATEIALLTQQAGVPTATLLPQQVEETPTPTRTPTPTATNTTAPQPTATSTALALQATSTLRPATSTPTPTALPNTGFVEDIGVPTMAIAALALIGIVVVVRLLRTRAAG